MIQQLSWSWFDPPAVERQGRISWVEAIRHGLLTFLRICLRSLIVELARLSSSRRKFYGSDLDI